MPPDITDIDPVELQLAILVVLEERLGPQTREHMRRRRLQFGDALDLAGGARRVFAQALARIRQRPAFSPDPEAQPGSAAIPE
jgi:hypothetical protein